MNSLSNITKLIILLIFLNLITISNLYVLSPKTIKNIDAPEVLTENELQELKKLGNLDGLPLESLEHERWEELSSKRERLFDEYFSNLRKENAELRKHFDESIAYKLTLFVLFLWVALFFYLINRRTKVFKKDWLIFGLGLTLNYLYFIFVVLIT